MKNFIIFFLLSLTAVFLNSCEKKDASGPIKIALIEPMSGPYAAVGQDMLASLNFYIDEINKSGGVLNGRKFEVVPFDNAMKAEKTTELLRKAIDDGIKFVTQGAGTNHALNIIKQVDKWNSRNPGKEVLYLNHSAVTTSLTNELCSFYHFRFDANVDMKVAGLVSHMAADKEINKLYLFNQNYAFGKSIRDASIRFISDRASHIEIVGNELIAPFGKVQDFTPYVSKIKLSGANAILTGNWGPDAYRLVNALADSGVKVKLYGPYIAQANGMQSMGKNALFNPIIQIKEFQPTDSDQKNWIVKVNDSHLKTTTFTPDFDRMRFMTEMLAKAINNTKSTEPKKVALELENMLGRGAYGSVQMRESDHQIQFDMIVTKISGDSERTIQYKGKDFKVSFEEVGKVAQIDTTLSTSCEMKKP